MDWTQLIIQLPIVAAFIWYSLELQKRFQSSMDKRDEAYLRALDKVSESIECLEDRVIARPTHAK